VTSIKTAVTPMNGFQKIQYFHLRVVLEKTITTSYQDKCLNGTTDIKH
jgi:hypothetical protein